MSKTVAIIGAGIGGLATANLLQKAGYSVTIYEKASQLGGRAGQKKVDGFTYDTGPSWYLMPKVFEDHFALFGESVNEKLDIIRLKPAYKVFFDSYEPVTIVGDSTTDAATFEAIEPGSGEALQRYVKEGNEIYQIALRHFLYTDFSNPFDLVRSEVILGSGRLLSLLTTPIHKRVSSFVSAQPLQQILEYPMVFLGTSPFKAPAMYSLMSALDFAEGVYYPKRGMYSIIEEIAAIGQRLGVTHKTDTGVTAITTTGNHATGLELSDGTHIEADIVISNADLHFTETELLPVDKQTYPASFWDKKEAGISAILMYLGVKGELPQLEHHNLYFVDAWKENFEAIYEAKTIPKTASLYVSRTSATDPSTAPAGHENLFMLVPLPTGLSLTPEELHQRADFYIQQFGTVIGAPDLGERLVVKELFGPDDFKERFNAWEGTALGMSHLLSQSALWRIPPKSKKLKNLYYVGANAMPGIGLPMCLIGAELVYKKITGTKTTGPLAAGRDTEGA